MADVAVRRGPASPRRRRGRAGGSSGHAGTRPWLPYALLALPVAVYGTFIVFPLLSTMRVSLYAWNGLTAPEWVGLANYRELLGDDRFWQALTHNGAFLVFYTVLPVVIAFLLVVLLTQERAVRGLPVYRIGLFVPQVVPMVVVGVLWRWMYRPVDGAVNALLALAGIDGQPWLGQPSTALPAVGLVATWVQYGFAMILFLAGIQRIDRDLYDAAAVDGAGPWARFRHVTLPGLRGEIVVAVTVSLIAALRVFDLVFVMTRGGPARATDVVAFQIWQRAFQLREVGEAAAVATVLVVLILVLSRLVLRFQPSDA